MIYTLAFLRCAQYVFGLELSHFHLNLTDGLIMREFLTAATSGTGGASFAGAATGQLYIAGATFVCFVLFGIWGAYWKYKDSKAIKKALEEGDLKRAIEIRSK